MQSSPAVPALTARSSLGVRAISDQTLILLIFLLTFSSGLINIYSVIHPASPERIALLAQFLPFGFIRMSRTFTLLTGSALIIASLNIWRRKRRAWLTVTVLAGISAAVHLLKGVDYEEATISAALFAALWILRGHFTVRSRAVRWMPALTRAGVGLMLAFTYGVGGFWLLEPRHFGIDFNWHQSFYATWRLLTLAGDPALHPHTRYGAWFLDSVSFITVVMVLYALYSVFRPVLYQFRTHPAEIAAAKLIAQTYGRTAQDFFKTTADKSFFFSHGRTAFLAYRVGAGFAVVLGDPVGPADQLAPLVADFLAYCRDNGWGVAFHQATRDYLELYEQLGLRRLKLGDDAVVDLTKFSLEGRAGKPFRSKVNILERSGVRATFYEAPLTDSVLDQAQEVSDEWLKIPGRRERQFTLGRFDRDYVRNTPIVAVEDAEGRMLAFANLVPSFHEGEATADLMRRRTGAPNGTMDYLFAKLFALMKDRGIQRFSLGMAPMSGFREHEQSTAEERAIHALFQRLNFVFSFKGLKAYKAKFASIWEPRYVIYRSTLDLPRLAVAIGRVSALPEEE